MTGSSKMPREFERAAQDMVDHVWRPELVIDRIPGPQRLAPHAAALTADLVVEDEDIASGRLVVLHDPDGNPAWDGTFRCVMFVRATIDTEIAVDPLVTQVGWTWLTDALTGRQCEYLAPSGTVTVVHSESFGQMAEDPTKSEVEIRASWTPLLDEGHGIAAHLDAWSDVLCTCGGLPPLPAGVVMMPRRAR